MSTRRRSVGSCIPPGGELSRGPIEPLDGPALERRGSPWRALGLLLLLGPQSTTRQCEYAAGATKLRLAGLTWPRGERIQRDRDEVERMATIVADLDQGALSVTTTS